MGHDPRLNKQAEVLFAYPHPPLLVHIVVECPIIILFSKFQEFCLDLYQPSGMGRRRKRTRKSRSADDEGHLGYFYPVTPSTKQRRNNSRVLNDPKKENFGTATNINDNVGVTVIMPPGK